MIYVRAIAIPTEACYKLNPWIVMNCSCQLKCAAHVVFSGYESHNSCALDGAAERWSGRLSCLDDRGVGGTKLLSILGFRGQRPTKH